MIICELPYCLTKVFPTRRHRQAADGVRSAHRGVALASARFAASCFPVCCRAGALRPQLLPFNWVKRAVFFVRLRGEGEKRQRKDRKPVKKRSWVPYWSRMWREERSWKEARCAIRVPVQHNKKTVKGSSWSGCCLQLHAAVAAVRCAPERESSQK